MLYNVYTFYIKRNMYPRNYDTLLTSCVVIAVLDFRFTNHETKEVFSCTVLHIPEMVYSQIEVFFYNKLVAVSRLIGSSLLPNYGQVRQKRFAEPWKVGVYTCRKRKQYRVY